MAKDQFPNRAWFDVTESAANTLTFEQVQTGTQTFSRIAWIITRVEWHCGQLQLLIANDDRIAGAICGSNKMDDLDLSDPAVYAFTEIIPVVYGTAANAAVHVQPYIQDFSNMEGGGLIVPSYPLYIGVMGTSLASAVHLSARVYFQQIELKPDEYIELSEATRMIE